MPRAKKPQDNLADTPVEIPAETQPETPVETPPPPPVTAPPAVKPKKIITEKQREALMRGQETRNANRVARKTARDVTAAEEKKLLEIKLVQKAEQIKKKTEKKLAVIDAISDASEDEDENILKPAEKARPPPAKKPESVKKVKKAKKIIVIESDDGSTDSEDYARSVDDMDSDEEVVYVAKSHSKKVRPPSTKYQAIPAKPVIRFI